MVRPDQTLLLPCRGHDGVSSPKRNLSVRAADVPVAVVCGLVLAVNWEADGQESTHSETLVELVGAVWTSS